MKNRWLKILKTGPSKKDAETFAKQVRKFKRDNPTWRENYSP